MEWIGSVTSHTLGRPQKVGGGCEADEKENGCSGMWRKRWGEGAGVLKQEHRRLFFWASSSGMFFVSVLISGGSSCSRNGCEWFLKQGPRRFLFWARSSGLFFSGFQWNAFEKTSEIHLETSKIYFKSIPHSSKMNPTTFQNSIKIHSTNEPSWVQRAALWVQRATLHSKRRSLHSKRR